jgi:hypothetical protein
MLGHASYPVMFVLAHAITCCLSQQFIFHTYNPPFSTRGLNTFIQANIMGARYSMYKQTYIQLTSFLLMLLLDPWAGQLDLDFHVGNT